MSCPPPAAAVAEVRLHGADDVALTWPPEPWAGKGGKVLGGDGPGSRRGGRESLLQEWNVLSES